MSRTETPLMDGWRFARGEDAEERYQPVFLPHDWAIDAPINQHMEQGPAQGFRDRWGVGFYQKELRMDAVRPDHRYSLDFGGVYERCTVWFNGAKAGGWNYGYSPFRLDVTPFIREGANHIKIRVDNTAFPADRWYSGCGIYRPVKLIEACPGHLDERKIVVETRLDDGGAMVRVHTGASGLVRAEIADGDTRWEAQGDAGVVELRVPGAKRWSAKTPHLYRLTLWLMDGGDVADQVQMRVGLRQIVMDETLGMLVNGEKVKLKGVCLHQDVGCRGIAAKQEIWRERLALLKEMGCNALRPSHHCFSAEFLDLCDEMGFYVYEEAFDKWTGGLYGRYFREDWRKDIAAMVERDRNRACIVMWGVGNEVENQAQPSMLAILRQLVQYVKTLDSTRPVSYAMNPHFKRRNRADASQVLDIQAFVDEADETEITDLAERMEGIARIAKEVDVIGCNYQEQWYPYIHEKCPDKLILGTEAYQYFSGHAENMKNMTEAMPSLAPLQYDYVIGSMLWTGYDYLGESMIWPAKGWSGAPIRTNRERKPGFYAFQSQWTKEPMAHLSVMDYSLLDEGVKDHWDMPMLADHWQFPQFHLGVIPYRIFTNCEEVRLWLNGERLYTPGPAESPNHIIAGFLPWKAGEVRVEGYIRGEKVCQHALITPGPAVQLAFDQEALHVPAREGYEALLSVRAMDAQGRPCFHESAAVRFRLEGEAAILAVDNGNLMHNEPYKADFIHMYHGVASVQIRILGTPGRIKVSAFAEGMRPGVLYVLANG